MNYFRFYAHSKSILIPGPLVTRIIRDGASIAFECAEATYVKACESGKEAAEIMSEIVERGSPENELSVSEITATASRSA